MLKRNKVIREWHDRRIIAGQEWDGQIDKHLESADVILLLVSPDFLASDYCYDMEVKRAMERHDTGEARVIPIILRYCDGWQSAPFGKLQALPKNARPVKDWPDRDKAFADVAAGIRRAVEELRTSDGVTLQDTESEKQNPATSAAIPLPPVFGFVKRRDEQGQDIVERLKKELAPGRSQPVTLSGPGGIGKTTLAAEAARELRESYKGRIVWSSADGRADFTLLVLLDEVATQLGQPGLRTLASGAKEEQVRALVADSPTLVVLDNYETVAGEEQKRIEAWFRTARCSALFTSRPKVGGTAFVPVSAMSREEADEFLERLAGQTQDPQMFTREVRERVYDTAEANPHVMQWVVGQIDEARVPDTVFEELAEGEGDAAERIFTRSFNLPQLGDDGRDALLTLSLFAPSASRGALAQVAGFGDDWDKRLDEAVRNLHALWLVKGLDGYRRLTVEGLTRSMAAARLSRDPRADEFRRRFVTYFLRYAEERKMPTPENYDALEEDKDNLLGAAEAAFTFEDWDSVTRMAYALARSVGGMLRVRGYWSEAVKLGEQALQAARSLQDEASVAGFSRNLATMYQNRGEHAEARRLYGESLEIEKRLGNQSGVALTSWGLGNISLDQGCLDDARELFQEALETFRGSGDQASTAGILHQLGWLAQSEGELEEARRLYNESLEIKKRLGNQDGVANTLHQLGWLAQSEGELEEARRLYNESLEIEKRLGNQSGVAISLHQLGWLAQDQGELEEARCLYNESLEIKKRLGNQSGVAVTLHQLGRLAEDKGDKVEAAQLFREALSIFERLGSPNAEITRRGLAMVEGEGSGS
jgi:tetratricopeptide (TPR) repeat protein